MIRKATSDDLADIMNILQKIIAEMHANNNFQWDENYPQAKDFAADIANGELFVAIRNEQVAGFICINRHEPEEYSKVGWSSMEGCLVIHRMGVSSEYRNAGVGAEMVGYADMLAERLGIEYLKTDTYSLNVKAQRLFQKYGYVFVGEMSFLGKDNPFYCYEKRLNQ